jgi:tripartite-type tricarboxylate transporter receptor subunit TctC
MRRILAKSLLALACAITLCVPGQAQTVEEFYKRNNTIEIVVGFAPGTGYDAWWRPIGRYMRNYTPGNPTYVIKNMPGGGSLIAANHLYNTAAKDGTVLGSFSRNLPSQAMIGLENVKFDPRKFIWIGSPEMPIRVCAAMTRTGIATIDDLKQRQLLVGGTGPGTAQSFLPPLINQILGTKFKVVEGYDGASAVYLAMERGEVDGICQTYESLVRGTEELFKTKKIKILFNVERQRAPQLDGAPTIHEFVTRAEDRQLLDYVNSSTELGRPLAAPPGVPADRVAALRAAFLAAVKDKDFLVEAAKLKLDIVVMTGEEIAKRIDSLYEIQKDVIARANALMGEAPK